MSVHLVSNSLLSKEFLGRPDLKAVTITVRDASPKVARIQALDFMSHTDGFVTQALNNYFKDHAKAIFGTLATHHSFMHQVQICAMRAPWVVHPIVPFILGGSSNDGNLFVMMKNEGEALHKDLYRQLPDAPAEVGSTHSVTIPKPRRPVLLPQIDGEQALPLVNDRGDVIYLKLPLDGETHTAARLSGLGFRGLAMEIKRTPSQDGGLDQDLSPDELKRRGHHARPRFGGGHGKRKQVRAHRPNVR